MMLIKEERGGVGRLDRGFTVSCTANALHFNRLRAF